VPIPLPDDLIVLWDGDGAKGYERVQGPRNYIVRSQLCASGVIIADMVYFIPLRS